MNDIRGGSWPSGSVASYISARIALCVNCSAQICRRAISGLLERTTR